MCVCGCDGVCLCGRVDGVCVWRCVYADVYVRMCMCVCVYDVMYLVIVVKRTLRRLCMQK